MVSVDSHRNFIPLLTPDGVDCISTCCPHCLASRTQKSPPFGLGDCIRRASFSPMGDAHSDGESYPRARGTRHERNFLEKGFLQVLGLHNCFNCLSQTTKGNSIYTCPLTKPTPLECGGHMPNTRQFVHLSTK